MKSTGTVGLATLCSRVLGFIRDILMAKFYGTTPFAEAFVVAFRIPNLLRDLVGEGAANAAFVPVLTEYHTTRSQGDFWRLARSLLFVLAALLFILTFLGILFSPVIVRFIAPGFMEDPGKLDMTITLTRIIFPFIFFVGLVAFGTGVLNSLHHFAAPAFGPALLNLSMILFLIRVCPRMGVTGLALAVVVGGLFQVVLLGGVLYTKGLRLFSSFFHDAKEKSTFFHPEIIRIWKLLVPRVFGSAVYQMSVIIDSVFASFVWIVGAGAPAALWFSYRLFHFPFALFGISLATTALPRMSREVAEGNIPALKETINFSMRSVFLLLFPAGIGLALLGRPIIRVLFERGEFTEYSTLITYKALFFYSFGLFAHGGAKILANSFFSLGDTRIPVKVATVSFFVNLVLNALLMWPLKIGGLALATSIAAFSNFLLLYILLVRKIGDVGTRNIAVFLGRIAAASLLMGIFVYIAASYLDTLKMGFFIDVMGIAVIIAVSIAIYVCACFILGIGEVKKIIRWILKKD